jgi:hypothetical protein
MVTCTPKVKLVSTLVIVMRPPDPIRTVQVAPAVKQTARLQNGNFAGAKITD